MRGTAELQLTSKMDCLCVGLLSQLSSSIKEKVLPSKVVLSAPTVS